MRRRCIPTWWGVLYSARLSGASFDGIVLLLGGCSDVAHLSVGVLAWACGVTNVAVSEDIRQIYSLALGVRGVAGSLGVMRSGAGGVDACDAERQPASSPTDLIIAGVVGAVS